MPKVFISHSNQDSDETLFIADSLRRAGIGAWVDYENIRGGADWLCEIQAGIQRCDAVVVVLSKSSAQSVWVERECLYAWQLRKPVFTALVADILIPLHLINIQYCDLRHEPTAGMAKLVDSIHKALRAEREARPRAISSISREPAEANFFPFLQQLPAGDIASLVARDLFHWARGVADEVAFGGATNPGFHARVDLNGKLVTIFSVRAYRRKPSAQIPLDRLAARKPFDRKRVRAATLGQLNHLLPKKQRFKADKANGRPAIALNHLHSADKLEAFKAILLEMIGELRAAEETR
ncbi:MAG: toll/interleukin-1 receptor domain-containing protein [Chloroflexi bacterium]|nr:toll/interleukin-1 receptor domain-containing protein [Chloroflexota bacterium]